MITLVLLVSCKSDMPDDLRTELNVWVMPNFPDPQKGMERLVKGFEMENPGMNVRVTVLDWGSAWTKITMAATAQNGPDVLQLPTTWAASITEMGALESLDSLLEQVGGPESFVPATMEYARPRASDSVTSLPWFVDVRPLFYRKDVLSKLSIRSEHIHNWADFERALKQVQKKEPFIEKTRVLPFGYPGKNDWNVIHNFSPWIWGAGGGFLDQTATKSIIASPQSVRGIMYYLKLTREGYNQKRNLEKNTAQVSADFDEGRLAFWLDASSKLIYLQRPVFLGGQGRRSAAARNYGVMLPPTAPPGRAPKYFIGGSNLAIFKNSTRKREAKALLRYLCSRQNVQLQMARLSGFLPTRIDAYQLPYFRTDPNRRIFTEMVQFARPYPSVHYWGEIETSILLRRFGNIFDLITESEDGEWPEDAIKEELIATESEINYYIETQLEDRPGLKERLENYEPEWMN